MEKEKEPIEGEIEKIDKKDGDQSASSGTIKKIITWIINVALILWGIWWGFAGLIALIAAFKEDWIVMLVLTVVIAVGIWAFFLPVGVIMMAYGYISDTIEKEMNRWEKIGKIALALLAALILPYILMTIVQVIVYFIISIFN